MDWVVYMNILELLAFIEQIKAEKWKESDIAFYETQLKTLRGKVHRQIVTIMENAVIDVQR